jgi:hypothetical protein
MDTPVPHCNSTKTLSTPYYGHSCTTLQQYQDTLHSALWTLLYRNATVPRPSPLRTMDTPVPHRNVPLQPPPGRRPLDHSAVNSPPTRSDTHSEVWMQKLDLDWSRYMRSGRRSGNIQIWTDRRYVEFILHWCITLSGQRIAEICYYISTLPHNGQDISEGTKKITAPKMCVSMSCKTLSETSPNLRRIQLDIITNVYRSSRKVPVIPVRF